MMVKTSAVTIMTVATVTVAYFLLYLNKCICQAKLFKLPVHLMSVIQEATKLPIDFIIACKYRRNLTLEINKAIKASDFGLPADFTKCAMILDKVHKTSALIFCKGTMEVKRV